MSAIGQVPFFAQTAQTHHAVEQIENAAEDLLNMDGMDNQTARTLASKGVTTMDALADLDIEELTEITGMEAERAKQLIMTARAPWFADQPA